MSLLSLSEKYFGLDRFFQRKEKLRFVIAFFLEFIDCFDCCGFDFLADIVGMLADDCAVQAFLGRNG